jgi:cytochrome c-type biogenesis protein CcsB
MVFSGALLRMWAVPNDANNKWLDTMGALQTMQGAESYAIRELAVNYFTAVDTGLATGHWGDADNALVKISEYQRSVGAAVYPAESKIDLEIWYNHADVFERLWPLYFLVGFMLLVLSFVKIIKPRFKLGLFTKASFILLVLFLIAHTIGLAIRWYISGHAPWSNGYESMVYIGWATVLAGFIFSKRSPITLAATSILAGLILFVAHLNWMDPQVTNLVPVLQSYWLSIHVATITASYGFLGLSALLGFITLILFILKSANNERQLSLSIKELNSINEMSLMIGLAMLTVGNFLGGVWANESWGRYWGWDPKETWALVTILVYAVVIHLRFIKALYTPFLYSVISLLSFTTVLMTYFGVNYYLAGMHSYAKGDPVPIPDFVPVTYGVVFIIIALAARNRKLFDK